MLNRLLFTHQRRTQLFVAVLGALVGMILVLTSLQLYFDTTRALTGNDLNKPQYLVINKEVNLLNTLFGGQKGFSQDEMDALRKIKGVKDVAPLTASHFKVSASLNTNGIQGMPGMYTELFFEAVPDNFLDVNTTEWDWKEGDSTVPIIIPRDYIKLYNFGFAPSQKLPQITESVVGLAKFDVNIHGSLGSAQYRGKLAGFSERINTILVPQKFIDYANEKFAGVMRGDQVPSRVIIECEGQALNELATYFSEHGFETSEDSMRNGKLHSFLRILMNCLVAIGSLILLLSLLVFFLYSQLLMSKSSYELETLTRIGYDYKKLAMRYVNYYNVIFLSVFILSIALIWFTKRWFVHYMAQQGFVIDSGISPEIILYGSLFTLLFIGINSWSVFRALKRLAK
ncbi:MAG: hypothetical protein HY064_03665 [Bacteroidetes bacterium]|nr:hypothetical protein [Bacteroidota bacterium]